MAHKKQGKSNAAQRARGKSKKNAGWTGAREGVRPAMLVLMVLAGVLVVLGAALLQNSALFAPDDAVAQGAGAVRLNEIMSENTSTLITDAGEVPDWIEIANVSSAPVEIGKYTLMLKSDLNQALSFPEYTLNPGECLVIRAVGVRAAREAWDAPFKLSAAGGDALVLLNAQGRAVDSVELPELDADAAYARQSDGSWSATRNATPGWSNDAEGVGAAQTGVHTEADAVELSEVMCSNTLYYADENGEYHDYVELHNTSDEDVNLKGWYLSDSVSRLKRWSFPEVILPAGGYLAVHCSDYERTGDSGHLHASFRLSNDGEGVYLSRPDGQTVSMVQLPAMLDDQAYSLVDGAWTAQLAPTPGMENSASAAAQVNLQTFGDRSAAVYISEIMASATEQRCDWLEIYNGSGAAVDLSGYGLTDDSGKPRKWQFPSGTVIQPGQYLGVYLSGQEGATLGGTLNADFSLASAGGYNVCLSDPQGVVLDAIYLPKQYGGMSYGRAQGEIGFFYFESGTPGAANTGAHYRERAVEADCSVQGGLFHTGDSFTVELSAPAGSRIYYTLDCSDPDESCTLYTGPISVSSATILRSRVYRDGCMPSLIDTQSYLYDVNNAGSAYVISLVSDPDNLTGAENGIISNYSQDWEREAHVEIFTASGESAISQGCGISLHGQDSRKLPVKSFNVIARSQYGENRFNYPIFSERDYESYQSILLRASGEDYDMSFMRDTTLSSLMKDSSLMYQKNEVAVVYLDGQYYTLCYIRERINKYSICQFEGWEGMEDEIDLVKGNSSVYQGSNASFEELLSWVKSNDTTTDAAYAYLDSRIDIQNFIEYMSIEIFTGNTDTLNVRRYRNARVDGKWRWALFDLDWAFFNDTDSIGNWLTPGGTGAGRRTDNTLFIACMKNPRFREEFLTYFGEKLATDFSTENVVSKFEERYARIEDMLPEYLEHWGLSLNAGIRKVISYAQERPAKLLGYFQNALKLSDADMKKYFGAAIEEMRESPIWESIEEVAEGILGEGEY